MKKCLLIVISLLNVILIAGARAEESPCFLRDGERWLLIGDSITDNGTYGRMILQAFRHFHPEAGIAISGIGVDGVASDYQFSIEKEKPTLISIMLGMNDVIHYGYQPRNIDKILDAYRKNITAKVREYKQMGADVVLMMPTLTDEAYSRSFWELRGTREDLKKMGQVIKEIADQEHVFFLPIQEELEAYQLTRACEQPLRPDGVHPSAAGQYQIARSFWEHMNFPGKLLAAGKPRSLAPSFSPVPASVALKDQFISSETPIVNVTFQSEQPIKAQLHWNLDKMSGKADLEIDSKGVSWSPKLPAGALAVPPGRHQHLLFDLQAGTRRSLYIIDLTRNPVLHFKDNKMAGELQTDQPRPEGKIVTTWAIEKRDDGLLFSGEVVDNDLQCQNSTWPWARDGVSIWLDLRPGARYGDIGLDEDVFQSIICVQAKPVFSCHLVPWLGRGMERAANAGGGKTAKGWQWHMFINHAFVEAIPFKITDHDYIGFNLVVCDEDKTGDNKYTNTYYQLHKADYTMGIYPNGMMIIDLNDKLNDPVVTALRLWGR